MPAPEADDNATPPSPPAATPLPPTTSHPVASLPTPSHPSDVAAVDASPPSPPVDAQSSAQFVDPGGGHGGGGGGASAPVPSSLPAPTIPSRTEVSSATESTQPIASPANASAPTGVVPFPPSAPTISVVDPASPSPNNAQKTPICDETKERPAPATVAGNGTESQRLEGQDSVSGGKTADSVSKSPLELQPGQGQFISQQLPPRQNSKQQHRTVTIADNVEEFTKSPNGDVCHGHGAVDDVSDLKKKAPNGAPRHNIFAQPTTREEEEEEEDAAGSGGVFREFTKSSLEAQKMLGDRPGFFGRALQRLRRLRRRRSRHQQQHHQPDPHNRPLSPYDEVNIIQSANDPLLAEGSVLPKAFGPFPEALYGKPIEEFDILSKDKVTEYFYWIFCVKVSIRPSRSVPFGLN